MKWREDMQDADMDRVSDPTSKAADLGVCAADRRQSEPSSISLQYPARMPLLHRRDRPEFVPDGFGWTEH